MRSRAIGGGKMQQAVSKVVPIDKGRQAHHDYDLGVAFFRRKQWRTAARHFAAADQKTGRDDPGKALYQSYYGLALVCAGDVSGLNLCRHAARQERHDAMVFRNLVMAEMRLRHRKRACEALAAGLAIAPNHAGLLKLRHKLGVRRKPCIPFLKRGNPINKWLGKATYHRKRNTGRFG